MGKSFLSERLSNNYDYTYPTPSPSLGMVYNIPVAIWVTLTHPCDPPIVFVTPTQGMALQPNQYVDTIGMVYFSYLNAWEAVSYVERGGRK